MSRAWVWTWVALGLAVGCGGGGGGTGDNTTQASTSAATQDTSGGGGTTQSSSTGVTASGTATEGGTGTTSGTTQGPTTEALTSTSGPTTDPATDTGIEGSSGGSTGEGSTGEGSTGGSTTGSTTDGSGSSSGTTGDPVIEGLWLTMIEDTSSPTRLYKVDLKSGAATLLCALNTSDDYNTSTFSRDGKLFAANASTKNLEIIDPCDCSRTILGPTNITALPGITADQALGLYGMDTALDNFISLSTVNGASKVIGPFGLDWGTGGLTWSDELKSTYALNGADDKLYTINHVTGKATPLIQTNYNFGSVGLEWHPKTQEIYACSNPAELLQISEKTGEVTLIGPMLLENKQAHCDNLAAPWVPIACVEGK